MKPGAAQENSIIGALPAAILIAALWGFNFVVIKVGVGEVPPLFLAALRFFFSAFPAILFVKRPAVPWKYLAAYGLFLGVGEFGLLFSAIKLGAPAGVASIFAMGIAGGLAGKVDVRIGAHRILDGELKDRDMVTVNLVLRP